MIVSRPHTKGLRMLFAEENAEFLAIASRSIDLSIPRTVNFSHLLDSEFSGAQFRKAAESAGYSVRMRLFPPFEVEEPKAWEVVVSVEMVATIEEVTRHERDLGALARSFGGHSDGWSFESSSCLIRVGIGHKPANRSSGLLIGEQFW
jgi:hypothetical protein